MTQTTTIKAGESAKTITLQEGKALTLTGSTGAAGVAYLLDQVLGGTNSVRSWAIGSGALPQIGPYAGTQQFQITCAGGSIDAVVQDAVVGVILRPLPANSVAFAGDSLQAQSGPITTVVPGVSVTITKPDIGWGGWMIRNSNGAINLILNAAVIGYTTEQILETMPAVIASGAETIFINGMTNDIVNGWPIARTKTALAACYKMARDAGRRVVMVTAPPLYKLTSVEGGKFVALNEWVREQARIFGCRLVDIYSLVSDPVSTNGWAKAGALLPDNTHLVERTARAGGKMAWLAVADLFQDRSVHAVSVLDLKTLNPDGRNLLSSALMMGTTGTGLNIGAIPANSVAAGMQVGTSVAGPTIVPSLVARADGYGFDQVMEVTGGVIIGSDALIRNNDSAYTRVVAGDVLWAQMWLAAENMVNVYRIQLSLTCRIDGVLYNSIDCSSSGDPSLGSSQYDQTSFATMPFSTTPFQLPASGVITSATITANVYFSEANGTIKLSAGRPLISNKL
jgi:lysophospholipase L1-like esterase